MRQRPNAEAAWPLALPISARSAQHTELTAVYIVTLILLLVTCVGCGVYRNRRRDAAELRAAQQLAHTMEPAAPPASRPASKPSRIRLFRAPQPVTAAPCPICLEPLAGLPVSSGLCRHPLHTACLVQWLVRDPHFSCPVCRGAYETVRTSSTSVTSGVEDGRAEAVPGSSSDLEQESNNVSTSDTARPSRDDLPTPPSLATEAQPSEDVVSTSATTVNVLPLEEADSTPSTTENAQPPLTDNPAAPQLTALCP